MNALKRFVLVVGVLMLLGIRVEAQMLKPVNAAANEVKAEEAKPVEEAAKAVKAEVTAAVKDVQEAVETVAAPKNDVPSGGAIKYNADPAHSTIGFSVKHLQITNVRGKFDDNEVDITYDPNDLSKFKADVEIKAASIDTANQKRDEHLRSNDFFGADQFPTIIFKSNQLEKRGEGYVIVGDLTIRGVTKKLTFPVRINGPVKTPSGDTAIGLSAETSINRQDFNVSWNKKLDNGGYVLDDKVDLIIDLELHQAKY